MLKPEGRLCWERPWGHHFSLLWPPLSAPTFGAFRTRNWGWPEKGLGAPPPGPQELGGESDREGEVGGLQRGLGFPLGGTRVPASLRVLLVPAPESRACRSHGPETRPGFCRQPLAGLLILSRERRYVWTPGVGGSPGRETLSEDWIGMPPWNILGGLRAHMPSVCPLAGESYHPIA